MTDHAQRPDRPLRFSFGKCGTDCRPPAVQYDGIVVRFAHPALLIAAGLLAAGQSFGQASDEMRASAYGAMVHTRLSVAFDDVSARDAIRSVSVATGVTIIGRYGDDRVGHGIQPETPIAFEIDDVPALFVLEMILEQCALYEPCTWQVRKGFVEVGTKERLSTPGASETRTYNIRDLLIEAPYFAGRPDVGTVEADFETHPYKTAALTVPVELVPDGRGPMSIGGVSAFGHTARKRPEELLNEIVRGIVETIEPGNWDYGQADPEDTANKIARLRVIKDSLVIRAPGYVHRRIMGPPPAFRPWPLTDSERNDRSKRASSSGARVVVLGAKERSR